MKDKVALDSETAIRLGSRSFASAAGLLSPGQRSDAILLYAWCRHCDDVIDGQTLGRAELSGPATGAADRLALLRRETLAALESDAAVAPPFEALRRLALRHDFPRRYPMELLAGFQMDVEGREYRTVEDTLDYAYHVAGVVGLMMATIIGARESNVLDRACDLGIAFQLTNIARDVMDDLEAGRIYLPRDWLAEEGMSKDEDISASNREGLYQCATRLLAAAEPYYESALVGIGALPLRSALAIAAARRIYRDIGMRLLRVGPDGWNQRVSPTKGRKVWLFAGALTDVIRAKWRSQQQISSRDALWTRP